jgi:hypothetical protein
MKKLKPMFGVSATEKLPIKDDTFLSVSKRAVHLSNIVHMARDIDWLISHHNQEEILERHPQAMAMLELLHYTLFPDKWENAEVHKLQTVFHNPGSAADNPEVLMDELRVLFPTSEFGCYSPQTWLSAINRWLEETWNADDESDINDERNLQLALLRSQVGMKAMKEAHEQLYIMGGHSEDCEQDPVMYVEKALELLKEWGYDTTLPKPA